MIIKRLGPNAHELQFADGLLILFSYGEPVAARYETGAAVKTDKYFSRTTSGHVKKWLGPGGRASLVSHAEMVKLAAAK